MFNKINILINIIMPYRRSYRRRAPARRTYRKRESPSYLTQAYRAVRPYAKWAGATAGAAALRYGGSNIASALPYAKMAASYASPYISKGLIGASKYALQGAGYFGDPSAHGAYRLGGQMTPAPSTIITAALPKFSSNLNSGSVCIEHTEFLADIFPSSSAGAFQVQGFTINAGLTTFPFLSQIAQNFESYKFNTLTFSYRSMSSDAILSTSASSALGTVAVVTYYDVLDAAPINKSVMENYEGGGSCKPSQSMLHLVECSPKQNVLQELYVRTGLPNSTNYDLKMYDLGTFYIATQGMQQTSSSYPVGELHVSYSCCLYKGKLNEAYSDNFTDHYQLGGVSYAAPIGVSSVLEPGSNAGTSINTVGTVLTFTTTFGNTYLVTYSVTGTSATITSPVLTPTGGHFGSIWAGDSVAQVQSPANTESSIHLMMQWVFVQTAQTAFMTFGTAGTIPTAFTTGDLWITKMNASILD